MMKLPSTRELFGTLMGVLLLFLSACQPSDKLAELRSEIYQYVDSVDVHAGVAVLTDNGDSLTMNNEEHFPMMSVVKFHQAIAVADYLAEHQIPLSDTILITAEDLEPNIYSPLRDRYPNGNVKVTIADLLKYTLQQSDNLACDILFDRYYSPIQTAMVLKLKSKVTDFNILYGEKQMNTTPALSLCNWTTPYAMVEMISKFCNDSLVKEPYYSFIRQMMIECQTGQSRLTEPMLGTNAIVGHKTGSGFATANGGSSAINDVGFIELPNGNRYSVAVFIQDSNFTFEASEKIISDISRLIYEEFCTE